jgi:hypothetical protein
VPGDEAARADALARGEIPRAALEAESARHAAESARGLRPAEALPESGR